MKNNLLIGDADLCVHRSITGEPLVYLDHITDTGEE